MYEDNEYIDSELLLNKTNASLALAAFTVMFQSGFFWSMPIELISFMSPSHLLINTAVIVPIFGMLAGVIYWLWVWVCEMVERGGDLTEVPFLKPVYSIERNWPIYFLIMLLLIFAPHVFPEYENLTNKFYAVMHFTILLIGSVFGCLIVLWNFSVMQRDIDNEGRFRRDTLFKTVVNFLVTSIGMGMLYGDYIVGEECVFVSGSQVQTAQLITSLDGMVAIRKDGQILMLNVRNLDSMACPPLKLRNQKAQKKAPTDGAP